MLLLYIISIIGILSIFTSKKKREHQVDYIISQEEKRSIIYDLNFDSDLGPSPLFGTRSKFRSLAKLQPRGTGLITWTQGESSPGLPVVIQVQISYGL